MNDLGQTANTLANIGVIVGILLLVFELSQNRAMMLSQTRNEISRGVVELLSSPSTSVELAEAWAKARQGETLTPAQDVMLETFSESIFRYWENVHYQYRQGMYDEEEFSKHLDTIIGLITGDAALRKWWCNRQSIYSTPFKEHINQRFDMRMTTGINAEN
jgi:hypothetical protein